MVALLFHMPLAFMLIMSLALRLFSELGSTTQGIGGC
jgi:hypothetical protein